MPYCNQCGTPVAAGVNFCRQCGNPLGGNQTMVSPTPVGTKLRRSKTKTLFKWSGIGCGGFLLLFVLLVVVAAIDSANDEDPNQNPATGSIEAVIKLTPMPSRDTGAAEVSQIPPTLLTEPTLLPTATPTPLPTATPQPPPIVMGMDELLNEYSQNKVRANARLRYQKNGKVPVTTSGYVSTVDELYVGIAPSQSNRGLSSYGGVNCYYSDVEAALHVTKGQSITVTGKVSGEDEYSTKIAVFDCQIEGLSLPTLPIVPSQVVRENTVQVFCISQSFLVATGYKGTGVIIDAEEGIILTVHHVISHENNCGSIEVEIPGLEQRIPASINKHCASIDRAHLRIPPQALVGLTIQPIYIATAPAQIDQDVYFWGFGTGQLRLEAGVVKSVWGEETVTNAYAIPGDPGSPVYNEYGHLLGTMSRSNVSDRAVFTGNQC